jgi:carboxyl-terminal processing protease
MPITEPLVISPANGTYKPRVPGAGLYEAPEGRLFARLADRAFVSAIGKSGEFLKVQLGDGRFGFVKLGEMETTAGALVPQFDDSFQRMPPLIELGPVALSTRDTHIQLKGVASDTERLLDSYIFVGTRKVYYRSNRTSSDPKKMTVEADLPLRPGANLVTVVSRENQDTVGRKIFVVRRDGPNGETLATPKSEEDEAGAMSFDE